MARKKSNYEKLQAMDYRDTMQGRDVNAERDYDMGERDHAVGMGSRTVITVLVSIAAAFIIYLIVCVFAYLTEYFKSGPENVFDFDEYFSGKDFMASGLHSVVGMVIVALTFIGVFAFVYWRMKLNLRYRNAPFTQGSLTVYANDSRLQEPEEIMRTYDIFPATGFHSLVSPSSMLSYIPASNKGLPKVPIAKRYKENTEDEDGYMHYKGEIMRDDDGEAIMTSAPVFDEQFQSELFNVADIPLKDKGYRKLWDLADVPYNPKKKTGGRQSLDKLKYDTIGELIKEDWIWPEYEVQRPGGVYIVDTAPVNTMMLAITRAGKGQTYIEPMIDMWTRESRPNNILCNDPKGELLRKFYVPASVRGYEIVQFNLINSVKTDIGNVLGYAAESAREGDFVKCPSYIEAMGDIFFPKEGADDPMWPNAANNAFKRSCFGLIDMYREEEMELRRKAVATGMSQDVLEQKVDELWGHVTLYNAYQFFVTLSSKKSADPDKICIDPEVYEQWISLKTAWEEMKAIDPESAGQKPKMKLDAKDFLTLFFDATNQLPRNSIRNLSLNADNSLRAMAQSDKTIASVYGIALTAMSFFTDPTISTLTSGRPSQNFDMQGLSFPRRIGVRFSPEYRNKYKVTGLQSEWSAYSDPEFKNDLGKLFKHSELVTREGWARYYFDGKFENRVNYIKCILRDPVDGSVVHTFYFKFTKGFRTSLDGMSYQKEPVTGEKIAHNGVLEELILQDDGTFKPGMSEMTVDRMTKFYNDDDTMEQVQLPVFEQVMVKYSEKPKAIFLVTPPHLMSYAKLILILLKQMVDVEFESSYLTKENQKPLYKTRYMLDELGNLQSEGHGIPGFQTMLSIGLGQDQQFTLILQTLQQLRDVYGESVDKIIQGNVSNIVFLKSTDDSMLETLTKLAGVHHRRVIEQEVITSDRGKQFNTQESMVSQTKSLKEEPVITMNDLLLIGQSKQNNVVFRAGDFPIWNRNNTALPMSWRLLQNTIEVPGKKYSLQTIPTLSTASEFDVRKNQPNFYKLLEKRVRQARLVPGLLEKYKEMHGYSDHQMEQLDPDILADEIMAAVQTIIEEEDALAAMTDEEYYGLNEEDVEPEMDDWSYDDDVIANDELSAEVQEAEQKQSEEQFKRYANGLLSRYDICPNGQPNYQFFNLFAKAYQQSRQAFANDQRFTMNSDGSLYLRKDGRPLIVSTQTEDTKALSQMNRSESAEDIDLKYSVLDAFVMYLAEQPDWIMIARGEFDRCVARFYEREENE